jgi:hypothetical protein
VKRHFPSFIGILILTGSTIGWSAVIGAIGYGTAQADVCSPDPPNGRNVAMFKNDMRHRGIKADSPNGIYVRDDSVGCEELNSIYIFVNNDNWVQIGWYEAPGNGVSGDCGDTAGIPMRFANYRINGAPPICVGSTYLIGSAPSWHKFRIGNQDHDNFYDLYYDDSLFGSTTNTGFPDGWNLAGTERTVDEAPTGAALGNFNDMYHQNGTGWHLWSTVCFLNCNVGAVSGQEDTDPAYKATKVSGFDYRLKVVHV